MEVNNIYNDSKRLILRASTNIDDFQMIIKRDFVEVMFSVSRSLFENGSNGRSVNACNLTVSITLSISTSTYMKLVLF